MIDVVMPVRNAPPDVLSAAIASVRAQGWGRWRLLICDDASDLDGTLQVLASAATDQRVRIIHRKERGGIAAATAGAIAAGDAAWMVFLDHDDLLAASALASIAAEAEAHPGAALIYTDEDKVVTGGDRHEPHFKPDFDPELLRGFNYIGHLVAVRRTVYEQVGGFAPDVDGAQDHDFLLRASEAIGPSRIRHVPLVGYHWRRSAVSTAEDAGAKPEAAEAQVRAVARHLERIRASATPERGTAQLTVRVRWRLPDPAPTVAVLIPTRDGRLLEPCLRGVLARTDYDPLEVIVVDNGSQSPAIAGILSDAVADRRVRVLRDERPFNFSALMNEAASATSAQVLLLLNDDVEVIDPGWLKELVSHVVRPDVGCAGPMLLYPDGTIQHAGIALGIGGIAGHPWRGQPAHHSGHLGRLTVARTVSAVTGACLAVRAEVWRTVGGMDAVELPVAFNDVDFCLRVGQRGLRTVWTPEAVLVHHESQTRGPEDTPDKKLRFAQEVAFMRKRWGALLEADPYWSPHLSRRAEDASIALPA
jgi:GT2 family glycosyltransferase